MCGGLEFAASLPPSPSHRSFFLMLLVVDVFWQVPVFLIDGSSADHCDFGVFVRGLRDFPAWLPLPISELVSGAKSLTYQYKRLR